MPAPSKLVLIAGGSGSGKTTLAHGLIARRPDWTLIHLDDYQKPKEEVPRFLGHRNWDDPAAVDFDQLIDDLRALSPGPVVVIEGYFALWHPDIRALADFSVFLDVSAEVRHARRQWKKSEAYVREVLEPMHQLHIQPTSAHANLVLHAGSSSAESMLETALRCLKAYLP